MSAHDALKDPFIAQLIWVIESIIHKADTLAKEDGICLTDSNVRSALIKAKKNVSLGEPPADTAKKDLILIQLVDSIIHQRQFLGAFEGEEGGEESEGQEIELADWLLAIKAVIESVDIRRSKEPGTRYYLDFLKGFLAQTSGDLRLN